MNKRISLLLHAKNISPTQLADELGVQRSGISHILNGRNKPSLDFIQKIIKRYPDINMNWLIFGEGQMMNPYPGSPTVTDYNKIKPITSTMELFPDDLLDESKISSEMQDNTSIKDIKEDIDIDNREDLNSINKQENKYQNKKSEVISGTDDNNDVRNETFRNKNTIRVEHRKQINKIVIFFNDKTFSEYYPEQ